MDYLATLREKQARRQKKISGAGCVCEAMA
jgi:hypothetical protein